VKSRSLLLAFLLLLAIGLASVGAYYRFTGQVKSNCGNSTVNKGEQCDDGNLRNYDGCTTGCAVLTGWACTGSTSLCHQTCGNGAIDKAFGENCDDGENNDGDGCSRVCIVEKGFVCTGEPSKCHCAKTAKECGLVRCGDGVPDPGEECDDGNTKKGDGCDASCAAEQGYVCKGTKKIICSRDINVVLEEQQKAKEGVQ